MNSCTDKCFANDDKVDPLFLGDCDYKYCINNKNDLLNPMTIWNLKKCTSDDKYNTVFDINLNEPQTKTTLEDKCANYEECICINTWKQLKQIFELTDEELMQSCSNKYTYPKDNSSCVLNDSHNDDQGENLEHFQLDGDYMFTDLDYNDPTDETNISVKDKDINIDKPKEQPNQHGQTLKKTVDSIQGQNKITQNNKINVKNTMEINENTSTGFDSNIKFDSKKSVSENNKQNILNTIKRPTKCCSTYGSDVDNKTEKKENNMEYLYTFGEDYRGGVNCGHKNCIDFWIPVPRHKGWISNAYVIKVSSLS